MMKGKRNEGKERKKNKKEKKREETNKGKNYNKIWYWRGEKRYMYFPPIWTVPSLGEKYHIKVKHNDS